MRLKNHLIITGAYFILILGIMISLSLLLAAVLLFLKYPDSSFEKRAIIAGIAVILAVVSVLITISIFETMVETARIDERVENLAEEESKSAIATPDKSEKKP